MHEIKISIIIPVHNQEKYIAACMDSVLGQTIHDIELICINDGSTDRTAEILSEYAEKYKSIRILHQKNRGAGVARNEGIKAAKGEFVAFMDSDDYYYQKDVLENLYILAKINNTDICGGKLAREKEGKLVWDRDLLAHSPVCNAVNKYEDYQSIYGFTTYIYKRQLLLQNNVFFPSYKRHEDPPFFLRAMNISGEFYYADFTVYVARKFDKVICIQEKDIIQDFMRAFDDMLKYSAEYSLGIVHKRLICEIDSLYGILFIKSLMNHDKNTDKLLDAIITHVDLRLLDKAEKEKFLKFEKCIHEPDAIFEEISRSRSELRKCLGSFSEIIIYGAGVAGKYLYSVIKNMNYSGSIHMCVSDRNIKGTACGIEIGCIDDCISMNGSAMVFVAGKGTKTDDMKLNAERLGYKNIQVIQYEKIYAML